jgi:hypothetical protein
MFFGRDKSSEYESALLDRAANFPEHRALENLTHKTLQQITRDEGVDFATALLFDRYQKSPQHAKFIQRIDKLRELPVQPSGLKNNAKVVIVPGALYVERPEMGGDGRIVCEAAAAAGFQTELIPTASFGPVVKNGALIRAWLEQHSQERIILVSLSKGGADLKSALSETDAPGAFRNVVAWVNVCGPLKGSRMANWILESRLRTWFFRWKFRRQGRDFQFVTDLRHGENTPLGCNVSLPDSMKMVSLAGFPLCRHMTTRFSRFCHRTLAKSGPNDGTTLLADLQALPGDIYPAWGMDHYFRPENKARRLVNAVLQYLAEEALSLAP